MKWKVEYIDYNITASVSGEKFWKRLYNSIPEPELVLELREPCNCLDEYDWEQHNNGGCYHYFWRVYKLDDVYYLIVSNNTREAFNPYEQGFIYLKSKNKEYAVWTETIQDAYAIVCKKEEAIKEVKRLINEYGAYITEGSLTNI